MNWPTNKRKTTRHKPKHYTSSTQLRKRLIVILILCKTYKFFYEFDIFSVIEFECPIWNNNHKILYQVHNTSGRFIALYSRCACVCTHRYIFRRTQMQRNVKIYSVWFIVNQLSELRMCWKHIIFTFYYGT